MEAQNKNAHFSEQELGQIRETSDEFFGTLNEEEGSFVNKSLCFKVFLALLISIPSIGIFDILKVYVKKSKIPYNKEEINNNKEENNNENNSNNNNNANNDNENEENDVNDTTLFYEEYDKLLKVSKKGFNSKLLADRIEAKSRYYEECLKIRAIYQNANYNWQDLAGSTADFMMKREIIKAEKQQKDQYGIGPEECPTCSTKYMKEKKTLCLRCQKDDKIKLYVVLANFFHVVGDADKFWEVLDKEVKEKLLNENNWAKYHSFFKRKNHNRTVSLTKEYIKEYGQKQYKEIIRVEGCDEIDADEELKEFNRKYNLALKRNDEEIDLREAKNIFRKEFVEDLSLIEFIIAKKIIFPEKKVDLNAFKPKMPCLIEIVAKKCQIKQLELDTNFFPSLRRLDLTGNKIEELIDIRNLANLPKLKKIWLNENPIEQTREIYKTENSFRRNKIEIMYDPEVKYRRMADIEKESDVEIRATMMKFPDLYAEDESEASLSLSDLSETTKKEKKKEQKKINNLLNKY